MRVRPPGMPFAGTPYRWVSSELLGSPNSRPVEAYPVCVSMNWLICVVVIMIS